MLQLLSACIAAPELFSCALDKCPGYSYAADWWSLGVCVYEMLRGKRPYEIRPSATVADIRRTIGSHVVLYPPTISDVLRHLLKKLLAVDSSKRLSTLADLRKHCFVKDMDLDKVMRREFKPTFVPSKDHLNCDPSDCRRRRRRCKCKIELVSMQKDQLNCDPSICRRRRRRSSSL
ncbi:Serine/threonine-protein kinase 32A [Lamellibrachia satsuma]|nr:Serine/threonine-protein kinase 32A [Lamellibrachia satsuma]